MEEERFLLVRVPGPDSINFDNMVVQGISPIQLLALAKYIEVIASTHLSDAVRAVTKQAQVQVPKQEILRP